MLNKLPLALAPLLLASLMFAGTAQAADNPEAHDHGAVPFELQLDNGQKWAIDAPLSKAMGDISASMRQSLEAIHADQLAAPDYAPLARQVNDSVAYMVANCNLPADADAQLHMVIAQLMLGAEKMAGDSAETPRAGAIQVIQALDAYQHYFDDAAFEPVAH